MFFHKIFSSRFIYYSLVTSTIIIINNNFIFVPDFLHHSKKTIVVIFSNVLQPRVRNVGYMDAEVWYRQIWKKLFKKM